MKLEDKPGYHADPRDQWIADNTPETEKLPIDAPDFDYSYITELNDKANRREIAAILWMFAAFCVVVILLVLGAMISIGGLFDA